jgi:ElaB/YqjD/DUF883 family membrane-anchored ribosome-binding protein
LKEGEEIMTQSSIGSTGTGHSTDWDSTKASNVITNTENEAVDAAAVAPSKVSDAAQQYVEKVSEVAAQAKDYVADKATLAGEKIKQFAKEDLGEMADKAKDYTRQNPGQVILISAAAGFLLGMLIRARR